MPGYNVASESGAKASPGRSSMEAKLDFSRVPDDVVKHVQAMQRGHHLMKVKSNGKMYDRHFILDQSYIFFEYIDSKKGVCQKLFSSSEENERRVFINDIHEVRDGKLSDVFNDNVEKFQNISEDRCFSVAFGETYKTLDLVAPDNDTKNHWVVGLEYLRKALEGADLTNKRKIWLREMFEKADVNDDHVLNFDEIKKLLRSLNIDVNESAARKRFDEIVRRFQASGKNKEKTKKKEGYLDFEEFVQLCELFMTREEINDIFEKFCTEGEYMSGVQLQKFFKMQQDDLTIEACEKLIDTFETCPKIKSKKVMSSAAFTTMFDDPVMDIFNQACKKIYHDMTHPLSHYFIESSHNTYLTGDQVFDESSVECYIRALQRGCRCVEIDCWDGDDNEPVVYHGYTLTSKILLKDVFEAIDRYAFVVSRFPVILSIENHCSLDQQKVMAKYMRNIFGEKLFLSTLGEEEDSLPSPAAIMGRIIVKGKKLPGEEEDEGSISSEDEAAELEVDNEEVKKKQKEKNEHKEKHKLARELSDCVVICQSVKFKNFDQPKDTQHFRQMASFSERKATDLLEEAPQEWIVHNLQQLSRVYPAGFRTNSSNYDPMPMWLAGNQMVALNFQTPDDPLIVNKALFSDNGGCGYILKPKFLRRSDKSFHLAGKFPTKWRRTFVIRVISGRQLPKKEGDRNKEILDPFVEVEVVGVNVDCVKQATEHIKNNGFNPYWNETMEFTVLVPDIAILCFRVMDHEGRRSPVMVAHNYLPVRCIKTGYRTVHLNSTNLEPLRGASLLVHIALTS